MIQLIFILGQRFNMTWKQVKMTASPYLYTAANYRGKADIFMKEKSWG